MFLRLVSIVCFVLLVNSSADSADCPHGWTPHERSCYFLRPKPITWENAKVLCDAAGGHLAVIESRDENNFLAGLMQHSGLVKAWIGLEDVVVEGEFVWITTQKVPEFSNWHLNNPSNSGSGGEDCGEIFSDGQWNDAPCEAQRGFVCEKEFADYAVIG